MSILSSSSVTLREGLLSSCEGQVALAVLPDQETPLSWEIIFSWTSLISLTVSDFSLSVRNSSTFRLSKFHDLLRSRSADSMTKGVLLLSIRPSILFLRFSSGIVLRVSLTSPPLSRLGRFTIQTLETNSLMCSPVSCANFLPASSLSGMMKT